jgi:hypothetical protein
VSEACPGIGSPGGSSRKTQIISGIGAVQLTVGIQLIKFFKKTLTAWEIINNGALVVSVIEDEAHEQRCKDW